MREFEHNYRYEYLFRRSILIKHIRVALKSPAVTADEWSSIEEHIQRLVPKGFLDKICLIETTRSMIKDAHLELSEEVRNKLLSVRAVLRLQCFLIEVIVRNKVAWYRRQIREMRRRLKLKHQLAFMEADV